MGFRGNTADSKQEGARFSLFFISIFCVRFFSFPFLFLFFPFSFPFLSLRFVATSSHPARPHFDGLVSVAWGLGRVEGGKGREGEGERGGRKESDFEFCYLFYLGTCSSYIPLCLFLHDLGNGCNLETPQPFLVFHPKRYVRKPLICIIIRFFGGFF